MSSDCASFTALYNFNPEHLGEIELRVGDIIHVKRPFDIKDWVEGENQRTRQCGLLPGTYLKEFSDPNRHVFEEITCSAPVCCALCSDYIWGKNQSVYLCIECNRSYHPHCAKDSDKCPGRSNCTEANAENPYDVLAKRVEEWCVEDVILWMAAINLFQYSHMFKTRSINGEKLLSLLENGLSEMGIKDCFHRQMIIACRDELIGNSITKKTRKFPGMKVGVKDSVNTHKFELQTFTSLTWCHECGKLLFGLVRQGLQCTKCELIIHRRCKYNRLLRVCPEKPMIDGTKTVYIPVPNDNTVPVILKKCIGAVESRGLYTWTIYRNEPDDSNSKYALRKALYSDDDDVDMKAEEWIDPLCPSAVLVSYLNELPNSILPPDMYNTFIRIAETTSSINDELEKAFESLPSVNAEILKVVLQHLNRVVSSEQNSLSEVDIGEIFGAIIMRPSQENLTLMARNIDNHTVVIQLLLSLMRKMEDEFDEDENGVLPPVPPRPPPNEDIVDRDLEKAEWYWGELTQENTKEKLTGCRDGSFLVRDSRSNNGYTLIVRKDEDNKQIRIMKSGGKYGFAHPCQFDSVPQLIQYYRSRSLKEFNESLDIMLYYPICREVRVNEVNEVKRAADILRKAGQQFNEKSCRYEELTERCFHCEQELAALEEATSAQKELINFLEEQMKIHSNFKEEAPTNERARLDMNYNLLCNRLSEQRSGLSSLEQEYLETSENRRSFEQEMNRLKPDLWELQHRKEKYMLFLEERNMKPEEVELLAGITDFKIYEFPMSEEEKSIDLSPQYWLFGELDRDTVKSYLDKSPDGTFLVRESKNRGMKAVSIMFDQKIKHFCIEESPEGFGFAEGFNHHPTIQSLVEHYHRVSLQMHNNHLATTLRMPVRLFKRNIPSWNGYP